MEGGCILWGTRVTLSESNQPVVTVEETTEIPQLSETSEFVAGSMPGPQTADGASIHSPHSETQARQYPRRHRVQPDYYRPGT